MVSAWRILPALPALVGRADYVDGAAQDGDFWVDAAIAEPGAGLEARCAAIGKAGTSRLVTIGTTEIRGEDATYARTGASPDAGKEGRRHHLARKS